MVSGHMGSEGVARFTELGAVSACIPGSVNVLRFYMFEHCAPLSSFVSTGETAVHYTILIRPQH